MGHRHLFSTSQMFETDNDQSWDNLHAEQSYVHFGSGSASENSSLGYPVENMLVDSVHFASHWNPVVRSDECSSNHAAEVAHYQPEAFDASCNPFLLPSSAGNFSMVPENYGHHASSSNYGGQTFHGVEGGFVDLTMGSGRGPYKRKSPDVPAVCEGGSTGRYYDAGSSSELCVSPDIWQEKPKPDSGNMPWDGPNSGTSYSGNGISIAGEGNIRNVRSRAAINLETNPARTNLSSNLPRHLHTCHTTEHSRSLDLFSQSSNASLREWNNIRNAPAAHGRILVSDASAFMHEADHFITGSCNPSSSLEIAGYHNDFISRRNHLPRNFQGTSTQSVRGVRSGHPQRSGPTFRASSSNLRLGHPTASDDGLRLVTESYSSRQPRPFSTIGWRNGERGGRARISSERFRSFSDEAGVRDRRASEAVTIVDHSAMHGSRNLFDQHRDMRLDIDNMSYEELLALGERIGNVSTGLSEDMISRCLRESIYCSSDELQEEGTCVICLEGYKNLDDVGTMRSCGHDFHAGCIRKWLSMKNLCPICKASALADT